MPLIRKVVIKDEGVQQGVVNTMDFIGSGVSVSVTAGVATVSISGGGGGTSNSYFPSGWG